jgi:hypothetical protein
LRVLSLWPLLSQEVDDLGLNMGMLAVLNMLGQNDQSLLPLRWANRDDCVNNRLSEFDVAVLFQAVGQKLEQDGSFLWNSLVKQLCRLDDLNFEIDSKVRKVVADLPQELLYRLFVAGLEEGRDSEGGH